jgi:drug/metabolite transporter (DMT)-like permease
MLGTRPHWQPYLVLGLGVFTVSWAAIFIRIAAAPALVTGASRLVMASLLLTPLALWQDGAELLRLSWQDLRLVIAAGVFLGLHFATWISSLAYTSVASSVVLVSTTPLFTGLAVHFLLKEHVSSRMFVGIVLATLGGAIIGWGDFRVSGLTLWGDLLAVVGAIMASAYFLIGRDLRRRLSLLTYVTPTYWVAALVLSIAALVSGQGFLGYPARTYWMFLLLAVGPQVIGHSSLNWALRYLSPTFITAAVLGEPVGSTILAHFVLNESPSTLEILGGTVILAGIYICSRAEVAGGRV